MVSLPRVTTNTIKFVGSYTTKPRIETIVTPQRDDNLAVEAYRVFIASAVGAEVLCLLGLIAYCHFKSQRPGTNPCAWMLPSSIVSTRTAVKGPE